MKLSEWAKREGISSITAWRWWKAGRLPVPARQAPSGTILVDLPAPAKGETVVCACVSSHDQKNDLDRQVARVTAWATEHGFPVDQVVTEIGSGLNGKRAKFRRLLADASVATIVVEHRDRLARFGVEYLEAALAAQGRRIVVVDPSESTEDLVRDMIEVLTSFCARLDGRRGARNRALRALAAARRGDAE
ncbi:IS607 family transposase [Thermaerobacter sp. FW80]|uniref:IS607 family transposase n=1 Tax=Thermaerobacter sp. FW80 TaxID=2546351 RepID=UPI001074B1C3|nr:IS607 family transposase [Thermaerobacter sp. FW80]QBS37242.1 IS607 family transposase [Thermaerobacter sp. FW80]